MHHNNKAILMRLANIAQTRKGCSFAVSCLIVTSLASITGRTAAEQDPCGGQPSSTKIGIAVTVKDRDAGYIANLSSNNFLAFVDKRQRPIAKVSHEDEPATIGLLVDTSGSIKESGESRFRLLRESIARLIQAGNKDNEYFLVVFSREARLVVDYTSNSKDILDAFSTLKLAGATVMYDACYLGLQKIVAGKFKKRALVLMSDGQDSYSTRQFSEIRRLLGETDVLLYAVNPVLSSISGTDPLSTFGNGLLTVMAESTGGSFTASTDSKKSNAAFEQIASELRNQYLVEFCSGDLASGERFHSLQVKLALDPSDARRYHHLSVRARKEFSLGRGLR